MWVRCRIETIIGQLLHYFDIEDGPNSARVVVLLQMSRREPLCRLPLLGGENNWRFLLINDYILLLIFFDCLFNKNYC